HSARRHGLRRPSRSATKLTSSRRQPFFDCIRSSHPRSSLPGKSPPSWRFEGPISQCRPVILVHRPGSAKVGPHMLLDPAARNLTLEHLTQAETIQHVAVHNFPGGLRGAKQCRNAQLCRQALLIGYENEHEWRAALVPP